MREQDKEARVVTSVSQVRRMKQASGRGGATVSRKSRKITASMGGYFGGGGVFNPGGAMMGTATNVYSPHLSTDFLELPQTLQEQRAVYRFFYNNDPFVGQAIDLHTELPLSKLRLTLPKGSNPKRNKEILKFFKDMTSRVRLLDVLIDATREYYVIGEAFIFAEDSEVEVPEYVYLEKVNKWDAETGEISVVLERRENADALIEQYKRSQYKGWERVILLPPDQVDIESYQYSNHVRVSLIPDDKIKNLVMASLQGDAQAAEALEEVPQDIIEFIANEENLPLGTDPEEGSFVYQLPRKKPPGEDHGVSILQRCLRTLIYRDKLRQTQTSIASRAMTPKRLVYAEDMSEYDVEELRAQVDMALLDPDYTIVTNFNVGWEEISARDRLLDLRGEYDITNAQIFAGLGVTESMLTGDSHGYAGEKINIEVINTRYMLYRERIQTYVEEYLFKPVARRKGFFEYDEFNNKVLLYPRLSFTRLALRDNRDTFDAMFNLYQKGSLSVDYILELFNLDPAAVEDRLRENLMTVNDAMFNEIIRSAYSEVGRDIKDHSDILERIVKYMKLQYFPPEEDRGGGRWTHKSY